MVKSHKFRNFYSTRRESFTSNVESSETRSIIRGNVKLDRDVLGEVVLHVVSKSPDRLTIPLVSKSCYNAVSRSFNTIERIFRSSGWEDWCEVESKKINAKISIELLDFVIHAGLVKHIKELALGAGDQDSFFNAILRSKIQQISIISGSYFPTTQPFMNLLFRFAPAIRMQCDKHGTTMSFFSSIPKSVVFPLIEVCNVSLFPPKNFNYIGAKEFRLECRELYLTEELIEFVRSTGAESFWIRNPKPPRRRRLQSQDHIDKLLDDVKEWEQNRKEFRPSLKKLTLEFTNEFTDHLGVALISDIFLVFHHCLSFTPAFELHIKMDAFRKKDLTDLMDLFFDIATFKGFTGKEVKGYVIFKKSYPIDEIEKLHETLKTLEKYSKYFQIAAATEYRLNQMEECYISKPLDILDDPEFSTNELKEKIANLIYKLQFRMNKDSYANVEINFKFLRIQQCESTTPSYYPIYPYGYHELEDEDFRFYQYI